MNKFVLPLGVVILIAVAASSLLGGSQGCGAGECPDIILITVESLRPDRMNCYGYYRNTSTNICSLAEKGIRYNTAYSPSSHTLSALPAIKTGMYPNKIGLYAGWPNGRSSIGIIPEEVQTMPEYLGEKGYRTVELNYGYNPFPKERNYDQGLDNYYGVVEQPNFTRIDLELEKLDNGRPEFVRIHLQGAHYPYVKPWVYNHSRLEYVNRVKRKTANIFNDTAYKNKTYIQDAYDENLRIFDKYGMGRILKKLKQEESFNDSLIIFASDHGQLLGEDGVYGHPEYMPQSGHPVYTPKLSLKVPLIVKLPGGAKAGTVENKTVSTVEIFATVVDVLNGTRSTKHPSLLNSESHYVFASRGPNYMIIKDEFLMHKTIYGDLGVYNGDELNEAELKYAESWLNMFISESRPLNPINSTGCRDIEPYFTCEN